MRKKIPKASKKRLAIFGTISIVIIFYFLFLFASYLYQIYDLKKEQKELVTDYNALKLEEKELRTEIEKLQDSDYIARYARETYSYSKDGEYILKMKEKKEEKEEENFELNIDYNYFIYGGGILLFFIILYIIKKRG